MTNSTLPKASAQPAAGGGAQKRKLKIIAAAAILLGTVATLPTINRHLRAASVLTRFSDSHDDGRLANFERHPINERPFCFAGEKEQFCGRMYSPHDIANAPGIVLLHGVHPLGIDEPRLVSFARALSASGITVFTPPVRELADFRISPASIPTIGLSAQALHHQIGRGPVGVIGFSFAGGLALLAAADPRFANYIGFVAAIGAHDDLSRVARFFFTDQIQTVDGKTVLMPAHEYGGAVLVYTKAEKFFPGEAENARAAIRHWLMEEPDQAKLAEAKLSPSARTRFEILRTRQYGESITDFLRIAEESHAEMDAVSPHGHLAGLRARVYLLHGTEDNVIPASEADWLASQIPKGLLKEKVLSPAIFHVDPSAKMSAKEEFDLVHYIAGILDEADKE
jgi:pimeloyl-ACP methyl ester carboxylesterase